MPFRQEEPRFQARESWEVAPQAQGSKKATDLLCDLVQVTFPSWVLTLHSCPEGDGTLPFLWSALFTCKCLINLCIGLLPGFTLDWVLHGDKKCMSPVTWHIGDVQHMTVD